MRHEYVMHPNGSSAYTCNFPETPSELLTPPHEEMIFALGQQRDSLQKQLAEAHKLLLLAKGALESANECIGLYSHPGSKLVMEALAAIDDSKLVEGLILCDAEPFCTYYDIDGTIGICRPDIEVPHGAEVPLYAPRRTEK